MRSCSRCGVPYGVRERSQLPNAPYVSDLTSLRGGRTATAARSRRRRLAPTRRVASTPARVNGFAVLRSAPALRVTQAGAPASRPVRPAGVRPAGGPAETLSDGRSWSGASARPDDVRCRVIHQETARLEPVARAGAPPAPVGTDGGAAIQACRRTRQSALVAPLPSVAPVGRSRTSFGPAPTTLSASSPSRNAPARPCSVRAWPSRQGTISPGATRAVGVTQEHPLRRQIARFG